MISLKALAAATVLSLCATAASAVTLQFDGGKLSGADGVQVGNMIYDVRFTDGTCVGVFSGCDTAAFDFQDPLDAEDAAMALLDQVFLDFPGPPFAFDSDPTLTQGCTDSASCDFLVPVAVIGPTVFAAVAANRGAGMGRDAVDFTSLDISDDTGQSGSLQYATFRNARPIEIAPVPLPAAAGLLLGALGMLRLSRRRAG